MPKKAGPIQGLVQVGGARSRSHARTMSHQAVFSNDMQQLNGRCLDRNAPGDRDNRFVWPSWVKVSID